MSDRDWYTPREPDPDVEDALNFVELLRSAQDTEDDSLLSSVYNHPIEFQTVETDDRGDIRLVEEPMEEPAPKAPKTPKIKHTSTAPRWRRFMDRVFPVAGDPWWEIGRKLLFLAALIVFIGSMAMLINESVIIPKQNEEMTNEIYDLMIQSQNGQLTEAEEAYDGYPEGISTNFKKLYFLNSDVRGWLKYPGCNVDRWVMYSPVHEYYLYRDIYKNNNKNGSLFFDVNNNITSAASKHKSLVIYGHNMASGQMFAKLNDLASSLAAMKNKCTPITLDTLYNSAQYKIFAVVLQDPRAKMEHYYSIQATSFASDTEFMNYVAGLRDRSLYDFNSVDVKASDELLILYTCSPKSVAGFDDARLAVVARKVRAGESPNTDTSKITQNKDVIMPYAWYKAKKKTPHAIYSGGTAATTTAGKNTTTNKNTTLPGQTTSASDPTATTVPDQSLPVNGSTTVGGSTSPTTLPTGSGSVTGNTTAGQSAPSGSTTAPSATESGTTSETAPGLQTDPTETEPSATATEPVPTSSDTTTSEVTTTTEAAVGEAEQPTE